MAWRITTKPRHRFLLWDGALQIDWGAVFLGVIQKRGGLKIFWILTTRTPIYSGAKIPRHSKNNWRIQRRRQTTHQRKMAGVFGIATRCENWGGAEKITRTNGRGGALLRLVWRTAPRKIGNHRNYHTQKQNKPHKKTKWNNYPHKQKNIAENFAQFETTYYFIL